MNSSKLIEAEFTVEGTDKWFPGFTTEETQNGQERPYFTIETVLDNLGELEKNTGLQWNNIPVLNAVQVGSFGSKEKYEAVAINGHLFLALGAFSWDWKKRESASISTH